MSASVGDIVAVTFHDHVEGDEELYEFVVYGVLTQKTRAKIVIVCWAYKDEPTNADYNTKCFTIARKAVIDMAVLTRKRS